MARFSVFVIPALFTVAISSSASAAEFLGCWSTISVSKTNQGFMLNRGAEKSFSNDFVWLNAPADTVEFVLGAAAQIPAQKGWTICLTGEGEFESGKQIQISEAFICTSDTTVSSCDDGAKIASSVLF